MVRDFFAILQASAFKSPCCVRCRAFAYGIQRRGTDCVKRMLQKRRHLFLAATCVVSARCEPLAPFWPTGTATCPCINPWAATYDLEIPATSASTGAANCDWTRQGDALCYPSSYGSSSCAAHDWTATSECSRVDEKPAWCENLWCHVDPVSEAASLRLRHS